MLTPLTFVGDDAALIEALRAGHPGAAAALYDRYAGQVRLMLRSILGPDDDIPDLLQEVFIRAIDRIGKVREADRLGAWLTTIAVFVGRAHIRLRSRRKWLRLFSPERTAPRQLQQPPSDARRALRSVYAVLDDMPVAQRMAFVLRYVTARHWSRPRRPPTRRWRRSNAACRAPSGTSCTRFEDGPSWPAGSRKGPGGRKRRADPARDAGA